MSASTDRDESTADKVAAWVLYAVQLVIEGVLFLFSAFSVMATDPCGTGVDEPRICSGYYFTVAFYGYWLALLVAALAVPLLIQSAGRRGKLRWFRPVMAIVALAIATVVYIVLLSQ